MSKDYSIFDVVGPNMIGPSSSHTAGAARLGKMARKIVGSNIIDVKFYLHGSFAETYKGHGTDKSLVGGILGFETDDVRIRDAFNIAKSEGLNFEFIKANLGDDCHPNTVKMYITLNDSNKFIVVGSSIGGGNIKITEIDGLKMNFDGSKFSMILELKNEPGSMASVISLLAENKKNIATIYSNAIANTNFSFVSIETDEKLEDDLIDAIKNSSVVDRIVVLDKF
ncbi:MAG: L-serine ammonia-lyase, iron-sulfur-dependent subunit beta [Peptostreptococcaceae bacterium]